MKEIYKQDLTGKVFGYWTVLKLIHKNNKWLCRCKCGKEKVVSIYYLIAGTSKSCGCFQKDKMHETKFIDLSGKQYGRLLILEKVYSYDNYDVLWKCLCECGNITLKKGSNIRSGVTKSCGCLKSETSSKHLSVVSSSHTGDKNNSRKPEVRAKLSGSNNHAWKGGVSERRYCYKFNEEFRKYIRDKFYNICFICGKSSKENNRNLDVHHIDYNKNSICKGHSWAFVPLCISCHSKTDFNRHYWFNLLINYWLDNLDIHLNNLMVVSL